MIPASMQTHSKTVRHLQHPPRLDPNTATINPHLHQGACGQSLGHSCRHSRGLTASSNSTENQQSSGQPGMLIGTPPPGTYMLTSCLALAQRDV